MRTEPDDGRLPLQCARDAEQVFPLSGVGPTFVEVGQQQLPGGVPASQRSRLGAPKAITATAYELARVVYHLLRYGMAYVKQTEAASAEPVRQRLEKQLRRRARELGFELKQIEAPAGPAVAE
jgi:hypothetical protein